MRLVWAHTKMGTLELLRLPAYVIPTLLFPGMIFLFFAAPQAPDLTTANILMAAYSAFAVLGVTFFQFGVGISQDRGTPWETFLRSLPLSPQVRFASRILSALVFVVAAVSVVVAVAHLFTPVGLEVKAWLRLSLTLLVGAVPFAMLGIALGYWAHPKAALPLANLCYLPLSYAGGLWMPPQFLPEWVATVSPYLPSRRYAEVIWDVVLRRVWQLDDWLWLIGYTLVFGFLALWGYQRVEGQRFH